MDDKFDVDLPVQNVLLDTAPLVQNRNRALEELLAIKAQGALRKGNIKEIASKYGISRWALYKSYRRAVSKMSNLTGEAVTRSLIPPNKCFSDVKNDVNVHAIFKETYIFELDLIYKLPYHGGKIGWYGWSLKELGNHVSFQAWSSGLIHVYPKTSLWEDILRIKLKDYGWPEEAVNAVYKSLKLNDDEIHLAVNAPGIPLGIEKVIKNEPVKITATTDKTPYPAGTLEYKLELRTPQFEEITKKIDQLPETLKMSLGSYLGSVSINQVLTQIMYHIEKIEEKYNTRFTEVEKLLKSDRIPQIPQNNISEPVEEAEAPKHCPHAKVDPQGTVRCGSRIIFEHGQAKMDPFPCFHPGYERCSYYV